ncbi:uncharacterized protein LOC133188872 isoform X1 [Saccostrea echinata]|uniref:uncharacterized protein LOC133188872 isoform X1 n=1 Tax=Saccostrea echinata TaxID=191078 RepID=UPI002A7EB619|nr:uncharacterized protein LOC133188872 isoform X1 [Saccostrea echinata]XP_061180336.1 uncharacterized protein LOC133188872 isoform X1 [Saccostrea echinata]XP_061180337.1 uncharacterized protein LOC133188872 isoform X1 [Saccostrea echinata]
MVRLGDFPWNFLAILLFVLLGQHTYVLCKFAYSFTLDFHGPYAPRDTYNTSCYAEASGEDSVSDVDVYLSFGSITYCNNSQVVPVGRNQSCSEATVQNRTTYYFSLPDLRISDSGTYSCKIHNKTTGALKISIHQNISVVDPSSITTQTQVHVPTTQADGTGGSTSIHTPTFSVFLLVLAALAFYTDK